LRKRKISLEQFTSSAIALEIARSDASIRQLNKELADAQKIKKAPQRDLETLKIQGKINDEKRRSAKAINDDIQKLDEDQLNRERVYEEMRVSIKDKAAEEQKAVVKNLMDYEVLTQADGARRLANIEIASLDRRMGLLRSDLEMAAHDLTKRAEIQRQLGELEQTRANAVDAGNRDVQRGRETALRNFRNYADQLRQMNHDLVNTQLETARRRADLQGSLGVTTPKETRVALAGVDIKVENERFAQYQADVISKVLALKQEIINIEAQGGEEAAMKKLQIVDEYYAQLKAATEQHEQAIAEIQTRERVLLEENLKSASEQIAGVLVHAETTLFKDGWKAAFGEVLQGFLQMILQMETKILASQVLKWLNKLAGIGSSDDSSDEGDSGGSSGGGLSGILGGLIKSLFSGGHAAGGSYGPGQLFPVNELGPEAFIRNGSQDMMWTGGHSGTVVPNSALQKSGDTHYHISPMININVPDIQAAGSGPTRRQVAQQYARLIQQAHLS
jgi:hypothetical protein